MRCKVRSLSVVLLVMAFLIAQGLAGVASAADSGGYGSPAPAPAASGGYGSPAPAPSSGGYGSPAPAPAPRAATALRLRPRPARAATVHPHRLPPPPRAATALRRPPAQFGRVRFTRAGSRRRLGRLRLSGARRPARAATVRRHPAPAAKIKPGLRLRRHGPPQPLQKRKPRPPPEAQPAAYRRVWQLPRRPGGRTSGRSGRRPGRHSGRRPGRRSRPTDEEWASRCRFRLSVHRTALRRPDGLGPSARPLLHEHRLPRHDLHQGVRHVPGFPDRAAREHRRRQHSLRRRRHQAHGPAVLADRAHHRRPALRHGHGARRRLRQRHLVPRRRRAARLLRRGGRLLRRHCDDAGRHFEALLRLVEKVHDHRERGSLQTLADLRRQHRRQVGLHRGRGRRGLHRHPAGEALRDQEGQGLLLVGHRPADRPDLGALPVGLREVRRPARHRARALVHDPDPRAVLHPLHRRFALVLLPELRAREPQAHLGRDLHHRGADRGLPLRPRPQGVLLEDPARPEGTPRP